MKKMIKEFFYVIRHHLKIIKIFVNFLLQHRTNFDASFINISLIICFGKLKYSGKFILIKA